ncbi:MAG: DUF4372 domain-containing protein [Halioglobus sp.]|nr:DUF4372 domain-containing protein [Halioglobus sp.]
MLKSWIIFRGKPFTGVVSRYDGDYRVRTLPCAEHFRVLAFAQLTYRESLRDIEACLSAQAPKLYHMGIRSPVRRATLADANERRDWRMLRRLRAAVDRPGPEAVCKRGSGAGVVEYGLRTGLHDDRFVSVAVSVGTVSKNQSRRQNAHASGPARAAFPALFTSPTANFTTSNALDLLIPEPAAIYVMDRGYLDFERLFALHHAGAFFVTSRQIEHGFPPRLLRAEATGRKALSAIRTIALSGFYTRNALSSSTFGVFVSRMQRRARTLIVSHQSVLRPRLLTICALYKARWQVELFFKWIKQHLRIETVLWHFARTL